METLTYLFLPPLNLSLFLSTSVLHMIFIWRYQLFYSLHIYARKTSYSNMLMLFNSFIIFREKKSSHLIKSIEAYVGSVLVVVVTVLVKEVVVILLVWE